MTGSAMSAGARLRAGLVAGSAFLAVSSGPAFADAQESAAAYARGLKAFDGGDIRSARVELLSALKENKENALARILFARVLLARGDAIAAQTEIERAIVTGFPREKTYHLTAQSLVMQRQYARALQMLDPLKVPPQFGSYAARIRGRAQVGLGKNDEALRQFTLATRIAPRNPETWVDLARFQVSNRQIGQGVASIERALSINPNHVPSLLLKGGVVRSTQGLEKALPFYNKAISIDSNNIEARLERAATLGDLNREKEARADIKYVQELIPGHPLAIYLDAVLDARAGNLEDAKVKLGQAKAALSGFLPAQMLDGLIALRLNNVAQANESFSNVVANAPNALGARRMLAYTQLRKGDAKGALETMKPFTTMEPSQLDPTILGMLGSAYAQAGDPASGQKYFEAAAASAPNKAPVQTQLAMTKLAQGDLSGAESGLQDALKSDPNSMPALMSLAMIRLRERNFPQALTASDRLIKAHPDQPIGYNMRGVANLGLRNTKSAEADFRAALAKNEKFPDARRNLAQVLLGTGRIDEGRRELLTLITNNPNDVPSLMLLARIAETTGSPAQSVEYLRRAVLANDKAIEPRAALIGAYVRSNQMNLALNEASALAQSSPDNPAAIRLLGETQFAAKKNVEALGTFASYSQRKPEDAGAKLMLGVAQIRAGKPAEAKSTLRAALALPNAPKDAIYMNLIRLDAATRNFDGALATANEMKTSSRAPLAVEKLIGDINMAANRPRDALVSYRRVADQSNTAAATGLVAGAQARMGDFSGAMTTVQQYRAKNPKDTAGALLLGDLQTARGDWKGAIVTYESLKGTPAAANPVVLNNLAFAYQQVGDKRALPTAAAAYRAAPQAPAVIDTYAWLLVTTKANPKQGLTLLQQAARGAPNDPGIRYHLGIAYQVNNMPAQARKELQTVASSRAPQARQAQAALASLR